MKYKIEKLNGVLQFFNGDRNHVTIRFFFNQKFIDESDKLVSSCLRFGEGKTTTGKNLVPSRFVSNFNKLYLNGKELNKE